MIDVSQRKGDYQSKTLSVDLLNHLCEKLGIFDGQGLDLETDVFHLRNVSALSTVRGAEVLDCAVHLLGSLRFCRNLSLGLLDRLQVCLDFHIVDLVVVRLFLGWKAGSSEWIFVLFGNCVGSVKLLPSVVPDRLLHALLELAASAQNLVQIALIRESVLVLVNFYNLARTFDEACIWQWLLFALAMTVAGRHVIS